ncbi:hypothetical protein IJS64_01655 [bacterium]|nr:hypothetical protein [bacterium]MBR4567796.1 hypothetical protein [bacterium]
MKQNKNLQLIFNFIPAQRDFYIKKRIQNIMNSLSKGDRGRVKIWNGLEKNELRALVSEVD